MISAALLLLRSAWAIPRAAFVGGRSLVHVVPTRQTARGDCSPNIPLIFQGCRQQFQTLRSASSSSAGEGSSNLLSLEKCLELHGSSSNNNVRFVDASWYHKGDRNGRREFEQGRPRIQGAVHFDLDDIQSTTHNNLSHMLPRVSLLKAWMNYHDIQFGRDQLIVYARQGCSFAPRVWFTLHHLGHQPAFVMQASLEEWMACGGPVETEPVSVPRAGVDFALEGENDDDDDDDDDQTNIDTTIDLDGMKQVVFPKVGGATNSNDDDTIILDARGSSFAAKGHMPGAIHVPYSSLRASDDDTVRFKSKQELLSLFRKAGCDPLDMSKRIVCTCGSGVSACSLYLALSECGRRGGTVVYDGSWQEWGSIEELPKVVPEKK